MMITGLEYYRRENRLRQKDIASITGVNISVIRRMLSGENMENMYLGKIVKLSDALSISVDDLLAFRDDSTLDGSTFIPAKEDPPMNCIEVYRRTKSLTLKVLAERLGLSKQAVSMLCKMRIPTEKHIKSLAAYEGISTAEFIWRYSPGAAV